MDNIPNLGDFGYVPPLVKTGNKEPSWGTIIIGIVLAGLACYFICIIFFSNDVTEHKIDTNKIAGALQN